MTDNLDSNLDYALLDKLMDRAKMKIFLGSNSAFYGSLMCNLNFFWVTDIETAATNGNYIKWNPHHFLNLPEATRSTVLMHELFHVAHLDMIRRGQRNPEIWNWACDIRINNILIEMGYTFDGTFPWIDDNLNKWKHPTAFPIGNYGDAPPEDIYDALSMLPEIQKRMDDPSELAELLKSLGGPDLIEPSGNPADQQAEEAGVINKVIQAKHTAEMTSPGSTPGDVEELLRRFLQPKVPWEVHVQHWMHDLLEQDYSWKRPSRRYQDMYLPSLVDDEGRLEHLLWFFDVSGSVTQAEAIRMASEVKYIKDVFDPKKLTICLFDTIIQNVIVINEHDDFDEIKIVGRGGTSLVCVRDYILECSPEPTAAVIFSDMCCAPMEKLPSDKSIPILWIGVNASHDHKINEGKIIYIKE